VCGARKTLVNAVLLSSQATKRRQAQVSLKAYPMRSATDDRFATAARKCRQKRCLRRAGLVDVGCCRGRFPVELVESSEGQTRDGRGQDRYG
jgi:hypothetical protein